MRPLVRRIVRWSAAAAHVGQTPAARSPRSWPPDSDSISASAMGARQAFRRFCGLARLILRRSNRRNRDRLASLLPATGPSGGVGLVHDRSVPDSQHSNGLPAVGELVEDPVGTDAKRPETAEP